MVGFVLLGFRIFNDISHSTETEGEAVFQHFSRSFLKKGSEEKLLDKGYHYEGKGITRQLVLCP